MTSPSSLIVVYLAVVMTLVAIMGQLPVVRALHVRTGSSSQMETNEITESILLSSSDHNLPGQQKAASRRMDEDRAVLAKAQVKKTSLSSSSSLSPHSIKGGSELERGRQVSQEASVDAPPVPRRRKVEVRHLEFESCGQGGTQYVVECTAGTEQHCYGELTKAGAVIVNRLVGSDYFVVCVDTPAELARLRSLTNVVEMEEDPVRTLSYLPELTRPVDLRELQGNGQTVPYGVAMVKADAFWAQDRGANSRVCIIDTGLYVGHEDMQGATHSGSTNGNQVVTPYTEDQSGHGTHVAGTVAAGTAVFVFCFHLDLLLHCHPGSSLL